MVLLLVGDVGVTKIRQGSVVVDCRAAPRTNAAWRASARRRRAAAPRARAGRPAGRWRAADARPGGSRWRAAAVGVPGRRQPARTPAASVRAFVSALQRAPRRVTATCPLRVDRRPPDRLTFRARRGRVRGGIADCGKYCRVPGPGRGPARPAGASRDRGAAGELRGRLVGAA